MRLKRFLEMRGADAGPWRLICGLPALWVGLLYDREAQAEAAALVADWTSEEREALRLEVPRTALKTPFRLVVVVLQPGGREAIMEAIACGWVAGLRAASIQEWLARDAIAGLLGL